MGRVICVLAAALVLAGCGVAGEPVHILTGEIMCYAGGEQGSTAPLLADATRGVTFEGLQVMWPTGYTARRAGLEVVVLDSGGNVKATTGRAYHISHAYAPSLGFGTVSVYVAAVDCGYPWDFVDCTANPLDEWCRPSWTVPR